MAMGVYAGTTLAEAQKILDGDYAIFNWRDRVKYTKVYLKPNPAIADSERAMCDDTDTPAVVEVLIKSEKMFVSNRIKSINAIKSARIMPEVELSQRTGYVFSREDLSELPEGVVTRTSHGIYTVQSDGRYYRCRLSGKRNSFSRVQQVFVGDCVKIQPIDEEIAVIKGIMHRKSQYGRTSAAYSSCNMKHIVIPNLDGLLIVSSVKEPPIWQKMLDKFLVIAERSEIQPLICINKIDLAEERQPILALLSGYEQIGYETVVTSTVTGEGIERLQQWLKDRISAVAGLSCVGKSALLNAVQPGLQLKTGGYSHKHKEGKHTTSTVELHPLDFGGFLADTPGIRELDFMDVDPYLMDRYFPEMRLPRENCAKKSCTHLYEDECAVKTAVEDGTIAKARYKHYCEFRRNYSGIRKIGQKW